VKSQLADDLPLDVQMDCPHCRRTGVNRIPPMLKEMGLGALYVS
jgi:hypothetical protein